MDEIPRYSGEEIEINKKILQSIRAAERCNVCGHMKGQSIGWRKPTGDDVSIDQLVDLGKKGGKWLHIELASQTPVCIDCLPKYLEGIAIYAEAYKNREQARWAARSATTQKAQNYWVREGFKWHNILAKCEMRPIVKGEPLQERRDRLAKRVEGLEVAAPKVKKVKRLTEEQKEWAAKDKAEPAKSKEEWLFRKKNGNLAKMGEFKTD